ncbi:uncharacterized protein LOC130533131 isoform X2 [Takifugu flavidus]|nr:uncharacterized protein LOC130533131 isoform X2 [Takifugu flavidus]
MKMTFLCDETMVITIPVGMRDMPGGHSVPEKFHCVFRDFYKVFVINGKPKPLGAAQAIGGVFIGALAVIMCLSDFYVLILGLPSLMCVVSGLISYAAGKSPNMHLTKLSFALNIISFPVSLGAVVLYSVFYFRMNNNTGLFLGAYILVVVLLVTESFIMLYLTYWLSKAVCRQYFNTLPIILLKRAD